MSQIKIHEISRFRSITSSSALDDPLPSPLPSPLPLLSRSAFVEQEDVFTRIGKGAVLNVLDGYNSTVFAYGQTGSGKTFTVTGGAERCVFLSQRPNPKMSACAASIVPPMPDDDEVEDDQSLCRDAPAALLLLLLLYYVMLYCRRTCRREGDAALALWSRTLHRSS